VRVVVLLEPAEEWVERAVLGVVPDSDVVVDVLLKQLEIGGGGWAAPSGHGQHAGQVDGLG
jgi:hypothetical protein